jgi:anti-anti-sigma factor
MIPSHSEGEVCVWTLSGRLTHKENAAFQGMLSALPRAAQRALCLDLHDVEYVDSFGLGLVLIAHDEAKRSGKTLTVRNARGPVEKLFRLAGLEGLMAEGTLAGTKMPPVPSPRAPMGLRMRGPIDQDGTVVFALSGRFTFSDKDVFQQVLDCIASGAARVILDLSALEFMDSAALSMFLIARDEVDLSRGSLTLKGPAGRVARLFELAGLSQLMAVET